MAPGSKRVALVIGSGSVKCAAAVGIRNVLEREGVGVDMLVGCSGGAIYAAAMATGRSAPEIADMARALWTRDVTSRRDNASMLRAVAPKLMKFDAERFGLRDDRLILKRLHAAFGDARIEDMRVPLHLTATDFATGELVALSRGSLVDAVRASIALPFAFAPKRIDGRLLVDGFLADPMPVSVAIRQGAGVIVAVGFESPYQDDVRSAGRFAFQLSSIMANNLLRSRLAFHAMAHHSEVIVVVPEFRERVRLFETGKLDYVIAEGERAMESHLPYLRELLGLGATAAPRH
jgi:NTE family protein